MDGLHCHLMYYGMGHRISQSNWHAHIDTNRGILSLDLNEQLMLMVHNTHVVKESLPALYSCQVKVTWHDNSFITFILVLILFQDLESAEDRREREAQDMEYAKELAEDDDDLI